MSSSVCVLALWLLIATSCQSVRGGCVFATYGATWVDGGDDGAPRPNSTVVIDAESGSVSVYGPRGVTSAGLVVSTGGGLVIGPGTPVTVNAGGCAASCSSTVGVPVQGDAAVNVTLVTSTAAVLRIDSPLVSGAAPVTGYKALFRNADGAPLAGGEKPVDLGAEDTDPGAWFPVPGPGGYVDRAFTVVNTSNILRPATSYQVVLWAETARGVSPDALTLYLDTAPSPPDWVAVSAPWMTSNSTGRPRMGVDVLETSDGSLIVSWPPANANGAHPDDVTYNVTMWASAAGCPDTRPAAGTDFTASDLDSWDDYLAVYLMALYPPPDAGVYSGCAWTVTDFIKTRRRAAVLRDLRASAEYVVWVTAESGQYGRFEGDASVSAPSPVTSPDAGIPFPVQSTFSPGSLTATGPRSFRVAWVPFQDGGASIQFYSVTAAPYSGTTFEAGTRTVPGNETFMEWVSDESSEVLPASTFIVTVSATNEAGQSRFFVTGAVTTRADVPDKVSEVTIESVDEAHVGDDGLPYHLMSVCWTFSIVSESLKHPSHGSPITHYTLHIDDVGVHGPGRHCGPSGYPSVVTVPESPDMGVFEWRCRNVTLNLQAVYNVSVTATNAIGDGPPSDVRQMILAPGGRDYGLTLDVDTEEDLVILDERGFNVTGVRTRCPTEDAVLRPRPGATVIAGIVDSVDTWPVPGPNVDLLDPESVVRLRLSFATEEERFIRGWFDVPGTVTLPALDDPYKRPPEMMFYQTWTGRFVVFHDQSERDTISATGASVRIVSGAGVIDRISLGVTVVVGVEAGQVVVVEAALTWDGGHVSQPAQITLVASPNTVDPKHPVNLTVTGGRSVFHASWDPPVDLGGASPSDVSYAIEVKSLSSNRVWTKNVTGTSMDVLAFENGQWVFRVSTLTPGRISDSGEWRLFARDVGPGSPPPPPKSVSVQAEHTGSVVLNVVLSPGSSLETTDRVCVVASGGYATECYALSLMSFDNDTMTPFSTFGDLGSRDVNVTVPFLSFSRTYAINVFTLSPGGVKSKTGLEVVAQTRVGDTETTGVIAAPPPNLPQGRTQPAVIKDMYSGSIVVDVRRPLDDGGFGSDLEAWLEIGGVDLGWDAPRLGPIDAPGGCQMTSEVTESGPDDIWVRVRLTVSGLTVEETYAVRVVFVDGNKELVFGPGSRVDLGTRRTPLFRPLPTDVLPILHGISYDTTNPMARVGADDAAIVELFSPLYDDAPPILDRNVTLEGAVGHRVSVTLEDRVTGLQVVGFSAVVHFQPQTEEEKGFLVDAGVSTRGHGYQFAVKVALDNPDDWSVPYEWGLPVTTEFTIPILVTNVTYNLTLVPVERALLGPARYLVRDKPYFVVEDYPPASPGGWIIPSTHAAPSDPIRNFTAIPHRRAISIWWRYPEWTGGSPIDHFLVSVKGYAGGAESRTETVARSSRSRGYYVIHDVTPGTSGVVIGAVPVTAAGPGPEVQVTVDSEPPCPVGSREPERDMFISGCEWCPNGESTSEPNSDTCTPCPPGHFSGTTGGVCIPCAPGRYAESEGSRVCELCPPGTFSASGAPACTPCSGATAGTEFSLHASSKCLQCPGVVTCSDGRFLVPQGVWWNWDYDQKRRISNAFLDMYEPITPTEALNAILAYNTTFYTCPDADRCAVKGRHVIGGYVSLAGPLDLNELESTCSGDGFHGLLCKECAYNYVSIGGTCIRCASRGVNIALTAVLTVAALAVPVVLIKRALTRGATGAWKSASHGGWSILVRILITHTQRLLALSTARISGPASFSLAAAAAGAVSGLSPDLVPVRCLMGLDFYSSFWMFMAIPVVCVATAIVGLFLTNAVHRAVHRSSASTDTSSSPSSRQPSRRRLTRMASAWLSTTSIATTPPPSLGSTFRTAVTAAMVIMFLLYVSIARAALRPFDCFDTAVEGHVPLNADFSVDCSTDRHARLQKFALGLGVAYLVLIPAVAFGFVATNKERLGDPAFAKYWCFLYEPYDTVFYWEAWLLAEKLALISASSFIQTPSVQAITVIGVFVVSLCAHIHVNPYKTRGVNTLAKLSLAVAAITQLMSLLFWLQATNTQGGDGGTVRVSSSSSSSSSTDNTHRNLSQDSPTLLVGMVVANALFLVFVLAVGIRTRATKARRDRVTKTSSHEPSPEEKAAGGTQMPSDWNDNPMVRVVRNKEQEERK